MTLLLSKRRTGSIKAWVTRRSRIVAAKAKAAKLIYPEVSVESYDRDADFTNSISESYRAVKERVANGGPGWGGWPPDSSK